ncbi:hypothetical protein ACTXT7_004322 [Hymenolepis weldensis]
MAICLASNVDRSNLDELAEAADKIQEFADRPYVHAVGTSTTNLLKAQQPDVLAKLLEKLELLVTNAPSQSGVEQRPRFSKKAASPPKHRNQICFYHRMYGDDARKCQPGCKYPKMDTSDTPGNFNAGQSDEPLNVELIEQFVVKCSQELASIPGRQRLSIKNFLTNHSELFPHLSFDRLEELAADSGNLSPKLSQLENVPFFFEASHLACKIKKLSPNEIIKYMDWCWELNHEAFIKLLVEILEIGDPTLRDMSISWIVEALKLDDRIFRQTQNSLKTLPSTHHAFVRDYIHHNEIDRVLDILKNRSQTGIFLDEVSANLLQESFIKKQDFSSALSVMWELCLQSHLEQEQLRPYVTALWLHTANELIKSDILFERSEVVEEVEEEIDMDTDFQSVPYLRNPNYDGWFDIQRPRLQLGHCLFSLSSAIENQLSPIFSPSMAINLKDLVPRLRLLAYALVEDSKNLLAFATSQFKSNVLDIEVLTVVEKLIESSDRRTDDSEIKKGVPVLLTESEVASTLEQFKLDKRDTIDHRGDVNHTQVAVSQRKFVMQSKTEFEHQSFQVVINKVTASKYGGLYHLFIVVRSGDQAHQCTDSDVGGPQVLTMASGLTPSKKSFHTTIDEIVKSITTDASIQAAEIELVESLYSDFESTRAAVWKNEAELHRRREIISTVKSRLRSLADEEERISYFENADTIEHRAWLAPRTRSERQWSRLKEWKKDLREYQQRRQGGRDTAEDL